MLSREEVKLYLIGIDNTEHAINISAVRAYMFPDAIMWIQEYYAESGFPI